MSAIYFDWSENFKNNEDEPKMDLECPNSEHHAKYGHGWETEYEATKDLENNECDPYMGCPCCEDDSGYINPIYNYIYPINWVYDQEIQIKILKETNCSLVKNNYTNDWFICLTGCGMDLTPEIAYTYCICDKDIPHWILKALSVSYCRESLNSGQFQKLATYILQQVERDQNTFNDMMNKWIKA